MTLPPRSLASRRFPPPEVAAAPAVRQSRFHGPGLEGTARAYNFGLCGGSNHSLRKIK